MLGLGHGSSLWVMGLGLGRPGPTQQTLLTQSLQTNTPLVVVYFLCRERFFVWCDLKIEIFEAKVVRGTALGNTSQGCTGKF